MIIIHVIIALTSIAIASFTFFRPTMKKLFVSYGLTILTILSGSYLLITTPSHILESCIMGLVYLTVVSLATIGAHVRLYHANQVH